MERIYIVSAGRTAVGRFLGSLSKLSAADLAVAASEVVLENISPELIDEVIVGNVISAGLGMNVARQVGVRVGVPIERHAYSVNMMCASGMQAVALAGRAIRAGEAKVVLCGGTESMSNGPYLLDRARSGYKLGDGALIDAVLRDGLVDSFDNKHMGFTAERIAEKYGISRVEQDEFALSSQMKCMAAQEKGVFDDEVIKLDELDKDEHPRSDTTLDKLASLRPAFKKDGSVTAGNASGINDGAAMLVVCDEKSLEKNGWEPLAAIREWTSVGCDPKMMGLGPIHATEKLCEMEGLGIDDFYTIELNEAFAAQAISYIKEFGVDEDKINPNGGAIAIGHPIGCTGGRLLVHLAHRIKREESKLALATLCVGGGMGSAMVLEAV